LLEVPAQMAPKTALRITKLWKASYAAGQDAYGRPWARLAASTLRRKRGPGIMRETDATFDATRAVPAAGAGVSLSTGPVAAYHQEESGSRPARPVIPDHGVPTSWIAAAREIGVDLARKAVSG
jgi:hypothetical protein